MKTKNNVRATKEKQVKLYSVNVGVMEKIPLMPKASTPRKSGGIVLVKKTETKYQEFVEERTLMVLARDVKEVLKNITIGKDEYIASVELKAVINVDLTKR